MLALLFCCFVLRVWRAGFAGSFFLGVSCWLEVDVLRARKRSSDRTAIAFTRRTETGVGVLALRVPGLNGLGDEMDGGTLEETAEGEE